jgi:RNA polymerase sigma factor for flagellar operon FliA
MPRRRDEEDSPEVLARLEVALALVPRIASQMRENLAPHARRDDLQSYGNEGALAAARTFDAGLGVPFDRWAILKIRGSIVDALRTETDLPRRLYTRLRALDALNTTQEGLALDEALSAPPGSAVAADARLSDRLAAMATAYAAGSLMVRGEAALAMIRDEGESPEEELQREQLKATLRSAIDERPAQERNLLERYYFDGLSMSEASGGLSRSWASRLHARAIDGVARSLSKAKVLKK